MGGTNDDEEIQEVDDLAQMEWVNTFFSSTPTQEVVGTSQLGGCPTRDAGLQSGGADACS